MSKVELLSGAILSNLLGDFKSRDLTARDLDDGYVGMTLAALRADCSAGAPVASVDFDLALKDLEEAKLVDTGPMVPYNNSPNSSVFVIGSFSNREFVYLTEKGYKAALKARSVAPRVPTQHVHISGSTFHQSPIGIGSQVTQSLTGTLGDVRVFRELRKAVDGVSDEADRTALLGGVEAMEKAHKTPDFTSRYAAFMTLAANHMAVISPLIPALSALLVGN